ncbi:hypothetical protein IMZ11_22795 [Microtetraspora sp. AC03309]|nr:hypothetical protein [Microtetraspora sp. AC03309]
MGLSAGASLDANVNTAWVPVFLIDESPAAIAAVADVRANLGTLVTAGVGTGLGLGLGTDTCVALS